MAFSQSTYDVIDGAYVKRAYAGPVPRPNDNIQPELTKKQRLNRKKKNKAAKAARKKSRS